MNWKKVSLTFLAFALLAPCLPVYAQSPPRPPVFIEDNYDLAAAIAAVPFTVNMPAEPVITSGPFVYDNVVDIQNSLAVDGRHTVVAPGVYDLGDRAFISGSDKLIEFQAGASFTRGFNFSNASRIKLLGVVFSEPVGVEAVVFSSCQDMIFERVVMNAAGYGMTGHGINSRLLFLSSSITQDNANSFGDTNDFIVANSQFVSTSPTENGWFMRWWGAGTSYRTVVMDSRLRALQNSVIRYEAVQNSGYFARNQIEGTMPWVAHENTGLWFLDNHLYPTSNHLVYAAVQIGYPSSTAFTITGNRVYAEQTLSHIGFALPVTGSVGPDWVLSDNELVYTAWPSTPPAWEMR